ncbi:MAG: hypothetical protein HOU81_11285 [Hamadaea sp.]|uniref:hypothetical protein n=1 Tax=Hamadaea sp. TaxID=2024425 RepID=UPI0017AA4853|nr:hypothetical protein [Hamadaea sp.]NUR71395.1 hypothetical protein [Hamadaea sp.]NUT22692.1 hypothetical protein [Hamadaea sp.]
MTSGALDNSYQLSDADSEELVARRTARAQLSPYVDFDTLPLTARMIRSAAEAKGAPADVLRRLGELDPELEILDAEALWEALGYNAEPSA